MGIKKPTHPHPLLHIHFIRLKVQYILTVTNLYERQEELDLKTPDKATVIGIGGVGSWVALDLAMAGVNQLYVIDHDHIEEHNLNRTPFKQSQIDEMKVTALAELVAERRPETDVIPVTKRLEDVAGRFRDDIQDSAIIDCRDHATPIEDDLQDQVVVTAGYDGLNYTLHFDPDYDKLWGEGTGEYQTVPSFIAPPQFIASMVTAILFKPEEFENVTGASSGEMVETIQKVAGVSQ